MEHAPKIKAAYESLGHELGWKWLYSAVHTLTDARVAFIGLNPGGAAFEAPHYATARGGSSYVDESWKGCRPGEAPLQRQVRGLFAMLGELPHEVLAGNLVPFRSPSWDSLARRGDSLGFGRELWSAVFAAHCPELVVCLGNVVDRELAELLDAGDAVPFPTGWGSMSATLRRHPRGRLVRLPHLSRFGLFGNARREEKLRVLFAA